MRAPAPRSPAAPASSSTARPTPARPAPAARRGRGRVTARAGPGAGNDNTPDVLKLHEELLKEIDERKRLQQELQNKLRAASAKLGTCSLDADEPPAAPARPRAAPPPPAPKPAAPAAAAPPPAPTATETLNIVFVSSEMKPYATTGGLGDVVAALPPALARRGHRVMVVIPRYQNYEQGWETGVRCTFDLFGGSHEVGYFHGYVNNVDVVFVDHPSFAGRAGPTLYAGDRTDVAFRAALLSRAALEAPRVVPCGGAPYGDANLVFVANDWQAALLPVYLQANYRDHGQYEYARSVLVLHNVAHQGRGPPGEVALYGIHGDRAAPFALDDPIGGLHSNILKAGIEAAHRVVAVSDGYAWEIQTDEGGFGLAGVLRASAGKLVGIVNGIDDVEWNPATDPHLIDAPGYTTYDSTTLVEGKAACKAALQAELGLPIEPDAPLVAFIGRLDHQKGVDLLLESADWLLSQGAQLVLLGSGRADLEQGLRDLENRHRDRARGWVGFDVPFAHRLTAGADIMAMPSRFEPCGLVQGACQRYGTPVVAHAVGGLRSTIQSYDPAADTGTGWLFDTCNGHALRTALHHAITTYSHARPAFHGIARRGMGVDWSWTKAAGRYEAALIDAKYSW